MNSDTPQTLTSLQTQVTGAALTQRALTPYIGVFYLDVEPYRH